MQREQGTRQLDGHEREAAGSSRRRSEVKDVCSVRSYDQRRVTCHIRISAAPHPWKEGVEAQNELPVTLEEFLDLLDDAHRVNPAYTPIFVIVRCFRPEREARCAWILEHSEPRQPRSLADNGPNRPPQAHGARSATMYMHMDRA
jgi:hypothetical protein